MTRSHPSSSACCAAAVFAHCLLAASVAIADAADQRADPSKDLTQLSLEELSNLQVSAVARRTESRARTRAAIQVVTPEDMARAGVTSLPDALALAPGVAVAHIDSSRWAIGIRGFTSNLARAQLVLIDGRSVYNQLFAGTYWDVQNVVLDDLDRIEVVRGPGGTLWGANAVNGIVSVVSKPAARTRGGLLYLGAGSEELFGNLRYGSTLGARGAFRVYVKSFARGATWRPDGSEYDDWHLTQGGFRADLDLASNQRLTFQGDLYGGRAGQRSNVTTYSPPYRRTVDQDARLSGGNVLARWTRGELRLQGYFDRSDREQATFGEVRNTVDVDLQHRLARLGRHDMVWGLGYRRSAGDSHGIETVQVLPPYRADDLFTGFVQDDIAIVADVLRVELGAKVEHNDYSGFEIQPSVRALWAPSPRHSFWAAATRAVRTPSRVEHDIDLTFATTPDDPMFQRALGNPDFASETLRSFELGYRTELGRRVSLDLSAFYNRYDKLLGLDPGSSSVESGVLVLSVVTANALEATAAGLEASVIARPSSRWLLRADYSYLSLDLEPRPGSASLTTGTSEEGSSPRHQVRVRSALSLSPDLELSAAFRWIDDLPAQAVDAYSELDARLAWQVSPSLALAVIGRNLLHPRHLEFGGRGPTPSFIERAALATVRVSW